MAEVQLRAAILHSWKITSYYLFTAYHLVHVAEKAEIGLAKPVGGPRAPVKSQSMGGFWAVPPYLRAGYGLSSCLWAFGGRPWLSNIAMAENTYEYM